MGYEKLQGSVFEKSYLLENKKESGKTNNSILMEMGTRMRVSGEDCDCEWRESRRASGSWIKNDKRQAKRINRAESGLVTFVYITIELFCPL